MSGRNIMNLRRQNGNTARVRITAEKRYLLRPSAEPKSGFQVPSSKGSESWRYEIMLVNSKGEWSHGHKLLIFIT